jgi:hypothetical protein
VAKVRKAQRAFVLVPFPGRDERQVVLIGFDFGDEIQVRQHGRPQAQQGRHYSRR